MTLSRSLILPLISGANERLFHPSTASEAGGHHHQNDDRRPRVFMLWERRSYVAFHPAFATMLSRTHSLSLSLLALPDSSSFTSMIQFMAEKRIESFSDVIKVSPCSRREWEGETGQEIRFV